MTIGSIRVLIADDTLIAREGLSRILETTDDIKVVGTVGQITKIERVVIETKPDIVVIDMNWMGDIDAGWMAIQELKKSNPKLKIIAITAYEHLIKKARLVGVDYGLTKTFTTKQLIEIIRELATHT